MLLLSAACLVAVLVALGWRVATAPPESAGRRLAAGGLAVAPIALVFWMASGPLAGNWAARAGTPSSILASFGAAPSGSATTQGAGLATPFTAQLKGSVRQQASSGSGLASVDLNMAMSGGAQGTLDVTITGQPLAGGGVAMTQGTVSLGPRGTPNLYTGHVVGLHGSRIDASASSSDGTALRLSIDLSIDQASGTVSGTVSAPAASSG
jgi:hypothetical protein